MSSPRWIVPMAVSVLGCVQVPPSQPPTPGFQCQYSALASAPRIYPTSICAGGVAPQASLGPVINAWEQRKVILNDDAIQKKDSCAANRMYNNPGCSPLAMVQGTWEEHGPWASRPFPGDEPDSLHDGDSGGNVCPGFMGVLDMDDTSHNVRPTELRTDSWEGGTIHFEWNWCRHFTGQISIGQDDRLDKMSHLAVPAYGPVTYDFAPAFGDEIAAVGEWIMDHTGGRIAAHNEGLDGSGNPRIEGGKAELHEVWMYAARSPSPEQGPAVLAPAKFGAALDYRISAQLPMSGITELWLQAHVPPKTAGESNLRRFECTTLEQTGGGCPGAHPQVRIKTVGQENIQPEGGIITFVVSLPKDAVERSALTTPYYCSGYQCGDCHDYTCVNEQVTLHGSCNIPIGGKPVIAGLVRCSWVDPLDLWSCGNCACGNPAQSGASMTAPVVGCAPVGLDPGRPEDRATACAEVCGGLVCGDAPACRISQCFAPSSGEAPEAKLLAREACSGQAPFTRVAPMGDYRVDFEPGSLLRFGKVDSSGSVESFTEAASTHATGFAYLNPVDSTLQIAYLEVHGEAFGYHTVTLVPPAIIDHSVTDTSAFTLLRARGRLQAPSSRSYDFAPGALLIAARATIDGESIGAELVNQGSAEVVFDADAGIFTLDGLGRDDSGQAVIVHLVGAPTNRPAVARVALSGDVECSSPQTTPVSLSSTGSSDPDPGDTLTHYQWFEEQLRLEPGTPDEYVPITWGIGIGPTITTQATLGEHTWWLHAYDTHLGSGSDRATVRVVDTIPPSLSIADTVCLWPPNHDWARFSLSDVVRGVADACDAAPRVEIVDVRSTEPADAIGSGSTGPDVVFGPSTACVRSERAGPGSGRTYVVIVKATDASGNSTTKPVSIEVPHAMSVHPACLRVAGVDAPDPGCQL